jgi:hypothetical protein
MRSRNRKATFQVEALDRRDVPSTLNNFEVFADKANNPNKGMSHVSKNTDYGAATQGQILYIRYVERLVAGH